MGTAAKPAALTTADGTGAAPIATDAAPSRPFPGQYPEFGH